MKIEFEIVKNYYGGLLCLTPCPNNIIEDKVQIKVGSDSCRACKYYVEDITHRGKNILICFYVKED
jgi:hypothetical protein